MSTDKKDFEAVNMKVLPLLFYKVAGEVAPHCATVNDELGTRTYLVMENKWLKRGGSHFCVSVSAENSKKFLIYPYSFKTCSEGEEFCKGLESGLSLAKYVKIDVQKVDVQKVEKEEGDTDRVESFLTKHAKKIGAAIAASKFF